MQELIGVVLHAKEVSYMSVVNDSRESLALLPSPQELVLKW